MQQVLSGRTVGGTSTRRRERWRPRRTGRRTARWDLLTKQPGERVEAVYDLMRTEPGEVPTP